MTPFPSARSILRAATADDHERVDAAFARFSLADRAGYARFLQAQAAAFLPTEAALERSPAPEALADWPRRRRTELLRQDLAALDAAPPPLLPEPTLDSLEAALGAVYVLEGSRLGGRMLARSAGEGLPKAFLTAGDGALWRELISALDATLVSEAQIDAATRAARAVFAHFEAGAGRMLKVAS